MLPEFAAISIDLESRYFYKDTGSLGSLMPTVQVELAGHVAEQIKFDASPDAGFSRAMQAVAGELEDRQCVMKAIKFPHLPPDPPPVRPYVPLVISAFHGIGGTLEEFSAKSTVQDSVRIFQDMYPYLADSLRLHWRAVEALAQARLQRKTLGEREACQVIGQQISVESEAKAQAYLERMRQELAERNELSQQAYEQRKGKKPP